MALDRGGIVLGPVIALVVVGLLALVLRWTFGGRSRVAFDRELDPGDDEFERRPRPPEAAEDYGLLCCVALADDPAAAQEVREMLDAAAIRATVAPSRDGRHRVLVFESDVDRARRVVGPA